MSAAEKTKNAFHSWCEQHGAAPDEVNELGRYLRLDAATLARLPMGDPAWLTRLRQQAAEKRRIRATYAATWTRENVGPGLMRRLTGEEIAQKLPERLRTLTKRWRRGQGALVIGPTAVGKSLAALLMARSAVYEAMLDDERWHYQADAGTAAEREADYHFASVRYGVLWASATALSAARRNHPLGKQEEPKLVQLAMECPHLFLDDLGWEPVQDVVVGDVLAERYNRGLDTVATSGERESELTRRYGAAMVRRVHEAQGRAGFVVDMFPKEAKPAPGSSGAPLPDVPFNERAER